MLVQMNAPQGVGYGIGLIFVLFLMQEIASLVQTHYVIRESHHCTLACSVMEQPLSHYGHWYDYSHSGTSSKHQSKLILL
jgi:hypothetical protein